MTRTQSHTVQVLVVQIHRTILVFVKMDSQVVVCTLCAQDSGLQFVKKPSFASTIPPVVGHL